MLTPTNSFGRVLLFRFEPHLNSTTKIIWYKYLKKKNKKDEQLIFDVEFDVDIIKCKKISSKVTMMKIVIFDADYSGCYCRVLNLNI